MAHRDRPFFVRLAAALAAASLLFAGLDSAYGLVHCPHHDAALAAASPAASTHGGHDAPAGHASHAGYGPRGSPALAADPTSASDVPAHAHGRSAPTAGAHGPSVPAEDAGAGPCTCIGACQAGTAALPAAARPPALTTPPVQAGFRPPARSPLPGPDPFTLPFATAPPRAA